MTKTLDSKIRQTVCLDARCQNPIQQPSPVRRQAQFLSTATVDGSRLLSRLIKNARPPPPEGGELAAAHARKSISGAICVLDDNNNVLVAI